MRGRKPKPTAARVLEGTWRKDRANHEEPRPEPFRPTMPSHLAGHSRRAWARICDLLEGLGVLVEADVLAIETAALAYERMRQAGASIKKHGMTKGSGAGLVKSPMIAVERQARRDFEAQLSRLGLTPTDRARLKMRPGAGVKKAEKGFDFGASAAMRGKG